ncbi:hypothetical protein [Vampirovibrio chlorellavorus]|uniref:hypothetical protein n=1 Tax=Vampirovibrio chlorellavorus TaxID=758823 RepID=UPI0026EE0A0E|nr:hypothetical protein [Vampirovibrio chlorellavorus]
MPKSPITFMPDSAIQQINSLGGPALPTGVSSQTLKVIMENRAASEAALSSCRVALAMAGRKRT